MDKTNIGLVQYAKAQLGKPYWYGCFGQKSTKSLYDSKKRQYPAQYQWVCPNNQIGIKVHDCVGLIKGYLWCKNAEDILPEYKMSQDVSANGMLEKCKIKGNISSMPDIPGVLVFMSGHVGVYIGDGNVVEARGHAWGVVKTKLKDRNWKNWGKCPWVDYIELENKKIEKTSVPKIKPANYTLANVRGVYKGWGSATGRKKVKDLTADGKKHAVSKKDNAEAFLLAGTRVTVKETKLLSSGNLWAKIPSGYICVFEKSKEKYFLK
ncbi:MAG: C40 family peptidase [Eubacterium sp.]|nr:C40 family peptidase [Eubacterium sp.]